MNRASVNVSTDWFCGGKWGVFLHFLEETFSATHQSISSVDDWNRCVDAFDVEGLALHLRELNAGHVIITLGQNSGYYCAPNATYDAIVNQKPSRLSDRDIVCELGIALRSAGIRVLVYLPSHAPASNRIAVERLRCTPNWDASLWKLNPGRYFAWSSTDERLTDFQRNWQSVIEEWARRWGDLVSGWWFDGCYYHKRMYEHEHEPNFASFATSARAGNPESIVSFNAGVRLPLWPITPHEDYTAGEVKESFPVGVRTSDRGIQPLERFVDGAQLHMLTYLGRTWGTGEPRFPDELLLAYTKFFSGCGGVASYDIPITSRGTIPDVYLRQLAGLASLRNVESRNIEVCSSRRGQHVPARKHLGRRGEGDDSQ